MNIEILPLSVFVSVTMFTPGPGNITSAAMGMLYGYRGTLRFMLGLVSAHLLMLIACAFMSQGLMVAIPSAEPVLRAFGVCYLLYLAYGTARTTYAMDQDDNRPLVFKHGFLLQAMNPKGIIFCLTIYTTFLSSISTNSGALMASIAILTLLGFAAVSLWAFAGTRIGQFLHNPSTRKIVNICLVLLLLYCAVSISGLL